MSEPNPKEPILVTDDMVADLPEPVQRYMAYTGVLGKPWTRSVWLKQIGRFRQSPKKPWMPMTAEQYCETEPPYFCWNARFKFFSLPLLRARDEYKSGRTHMFAKLAGVYTIFDVRGEELDQGAMLRYLSEMIWFPIAFLGENITWQEIDEHSALVTLSDYGESVSGHLHFDKDGRPFNFTTMRYRESDGNFPLIPGLLPFRLIKT